MAFASGSEVALAYAPQAEFGKVPAAPSFKALRSVSGGLRTVKATGTSDERRPDGNVVDEFMLGKDVTGSITGEWSYGSLDDILASAFRSAWQGNVLKNGVEDHYLLFEERRAIGGGESISRFDSVRVSTFALTIGARAKINTTIGLMGRAETLDTKPVNGATYEDGSTTPISTSSATVAKLEVAGIAEAPKVTNLTMNIANGLRVRAVVGSEYTEEFGNGRFEVSGTMECFFRSNELYQKVLDHGSGKLSLVVGNAETQRYKLSLGKIIFGDGEVTSGGNNDDVMVNIPFRAVLDTATACTMMIERAVRLVPAGG